MTASISSGGSTEDPLEALLCFDLYAASRAVTARYRPLLADLDLTYPQYLVLVVLQDGAGTVGSIGRALHLDHGTLTPLLRRMEQAGLLSRSRSGADERVVEVAATAQGLIVARRFEDVQCRIRESMGLDEERMQSLQQTLRDLRTAVELSTP